MPGPAEIVVERAIAHLLKPNEPTGSVFSGDPLPLEDYPKIVSFLQKHIYKSLNHDEIRAAGFKSNGTTPNHARSLCLSLIRQDTKFVRASQLLGQRLNELLKKNQRISTGTLACCVFRLQPNAARRLALLKLDPTETIVQQTVTKGGKRIVVWEPTDNALPSTAQDLQKCAFVSSSTGTSESELRILDWQNRSSIEPARFFTGGFLEAELIADEALLTRKFHSVASRSIESLRAIVGNKRADAAKRLIDAALFSSKIVVNNFVDSLNLPDDIKEQVRASIRAEVDQSFTPDEDVADRLTKKVRIAGNFGLRVAVEREHFERIIELGPDKKDPELGPYRELKVRAYGYKEE